MNKLSIKDFKTKGWFLENDDLKIVAILSDLYPADINCLNCSKFYTTWDQDPEGNYWVGVKVASSELVIKASSVILITDIDIIYNS